MIFFHQKMLSSASRLRSRRSPTGNLRTKYRISVENLKPRFLSIAVDNNSNIYFPDTRGVIAQETYDYYDDRNRLLDLFTTSFNEKKLIKDKCQLLCSFVLSLCKMFLQKPVKEFNVEYAGKNMNIQILSRQILHVKSPVGVYAEEIFNYRYERYMKLGRIVRNTTEPIGAWVFVLLAFAFPWLFTFMLAMIPVFIVCLISKISSLIIRP